MNSTPGRKHFIPYLLILAISLLTELFLFNYKHWQTIHNHEIIPEEIILGDAYISNGDGTYSSGEGDYSITVSGFDLDLKSVYFNITIPSQDPTLPDATTIYQFATDAGHSFEYSLPVKTLWSNQPKSCYYTYHLYGNCTGLRFLPNLTPCSPISIEIRLNPVIPFSFSLPRCSLFGSYPT